MIHLDVTHRVWEIGSHKKPDDRTAEVRGIAGMKSGFHFFDASPEESSQFNLPHSAGGRMSSKIN
jgi:hypothetical protein